MDKKTLLKIPQFKADNAYIDAAVLSCGKWIARFEENTANEQKIKMLYLFSVEKLKQNNTSASYIVFCTNDDYITFLPYEKKWSSASIDYYLNYYDYYKNKTCSFAEKQSFLNMCSFLNCTEAPIDEFMKFQTKIRNKRLDEKHQKEIDRINSEMSLVPPPPKNFNAWAEEYAMKNSRYIFYDYKKSRTNTGYCSHCGQNVEITDPKHNKPGKCPDCKSDITFKAKGKSKKIFDFGNAAIIQKMKNGKSVLRYFFLKKSYADIKGPQFTVYEFRRIIIDGKEIRFYENTDKVMWIDTTNYKIWLTTHYLKSDPFLYTQNLKTAIKNTDFQYSAIYEYAKYIKSFDILQYIKTYFKYPAMEYIIKLKLYSLYADLSSYYYNPYKKATDIFDLNGKSFSEVVKVSKNILTHGAKINANYDQFELMNLCDKNYKNFTDDQILFFGKYCRCDKLKLLIKYSTLEKIKNYLIKESVLLRHSIDSVANDYHDYIKCCEKLKINLSNEINLFPRNLPDKHDKASKLYMKLKDNIIKKEIESLYETIKNKYTWKYKDFIFQVPKNYKEIELEATELNQCLISNDYVDKFADKEIVLIFIRNKSEPDKPFYTLELDSLDRFKQCRGYQSNGREQDIGHDNSEMTSEIKNAVNMYIKHLNKNQLRKGA